MHSHRWQDVIQHLSLGKTAGFSMEVLVGSSDYQEETAPGMQGLKLESSIEVSTVQALLVLLSPGRQRGKYLCLFHRWILSV